MASACRENPEYRARMEADPKAALAEAGVSIGDCEVRVVVDTDEVRHMVLPLDPNAALADDQLTTLAGGVYGCIGPLRCACVSFPGPGAQIQWL